MARVAFAIGYLIGVKVHIHQLRGLGFILHMFTLVCLFGDITHHNLLEKYFA